MFSENAFRPFREWIINLFAWALTGITILVLMFAVYLFFLGSEQRGAGRPKRREGANLDKKMNRL